jgi:hypothetical protein
MDRGYLDADNGGFHRSENIPGILFGTTGNVDICPIAEDNKLHPNPYYFVTYLGFVNCGLIGIVG